jgi:hypothetical protein
MVRSDIRCSGWKGFGTRPGPHVNDTQVKGGKELLLEVSRELLKRHSRPSIRIEGADVSKL